IQAILKNEQVELDLPVKIDYIPNKLLDLTIEGQPEIDENLSFYSIFKRGKILGLNKVNATHEIPVPGGGNIIRGVSLRNVPLTELFETATKYSPLELNGDFFKRFVLEVKDSSKF